MYCFNIDWLLGFYFQENGFWSNLNKNKKEYVNIPGRIKKKIYDIQHKVTLSFQSLNNCTGENLVLSRKNS